ncbi:GNAT family N-acetyltransferase [Halanaerocella petrolearia]
MKCKIVESTEELNQALNLRKEVFVQEQGVSLELEIDGKDNEAEHFIVKEGEEVIGTCRLRNQAEIGKVERMAVRSKFRKQGIGTELITKVISFATRNNLSALTLHAQLSARDFYNKNGFQVVSEEIIIEAGIEHLKMKLEL